MKLLSNPIVVGALVLTAVGLVAHSILFPKPGQSRPRNAATTAPTPAVPSPTPLTTNLALAATKNPGSTNALPAAALDSEYARSHYVAWVEAPRRDPFQVYGPHAGLRPEDLPSAAQLLTLKAVWRQSGSTLAVVNQQVCGEGDEIAGFRIERIEGEQILVRGPGGLELIEFRGPLNPNATNVISTNTVRLTAAK